MPVNADEQRLFQILAQREEKNPSTPIDQKTVEEFRQGAGLFLEFGGKTESIAMKDDFILARDGYLIPIRIFNSDAIATGSVLIMFPGGGYVMNTFAANTIVCSRIAKYSGLKVILVNYRLTPENPMPTPMMDALDATLYIANHADEFKLDPDKLAIAGFSAGAHCAAVISNLAQTKKDLKIKQQILLNGPYDAALNKRDYVEYESQDFMVSRAVINYIYKLWRLPDTELYSPLYSPYYETNLNKLPKTTILVAEFDGMRSDSEMYFQKLKTNGCQVSKLVLPGQCHHTILLRGAIQDVKDPAEVIAEIFMGT